MIAAQPGTAPGFAWRNLGHLHRACRLRIYMSAAHTTTIRVPTETRDRLNALALRRGEPAGEVVAKLVSAADEDAMLAEIAAGFEELAGDPKALAAYRAESEELEAGFEAPAPEW
jgi:predicted DNA-binding protein